MDRHEMGDGVVLAVKPSGDGAVDSMIAAFEWTRVRWRLAVRLEMAGEVSLGLVWLEANGARM